MPFLSFLSLSFLSCPEVLENEVRQEEWAALARQFRESVEVIREKAQFSLWVHK